MDLKFWQRFTEAFFFIRSLGIDISSFLSAVHWTMIEPPGCQSDDFDGSSIRINRSWLKGLRISVVTMCHSFPMFLPLCDSQGSGSRKGSEPKSHSTMPLGDEHPLYHLFCIEGHRVLAPSRMVW